MFSSTAVFCFKQEISANVDCNITKANNCFRLTHLVTLGKQLEALFFTFKVINKLEGVLKSHFLNKQNGCQNNYQKLRGIRATYRLQKRASQILNL